MILVLQLLGEEIISICTRLQEMVFSTFQYLSKHKKDNDTCTSIDISCGYTRTE